MECLFCFENIDNKYPYVICINCNKIYHTKCWLQWNKLNNKKIFSKDTKCIYCQNYNTIFWWKGKK